MQSTTQFTAATEILALVDEKLAQKPSSTVKVKEISLTMTPPGELVPVDEDQSHTIPNIVEVSEISGKILDIIFDYALNKFNDSKERFAAGRPKFLSVIDKFVAANTQVLMCLPAFPFKSANKIDKVLGSLPDKAEELSLERLNTMCRRIGEFYQPGAKLTIISDGLVYNDLLGISDRDTWAYGESLRNMAVQKGFKSIDFSRLRDLVTFPLPDKLDEITYIANATNFRRFLFNNYGNEDLKIEQEIILNPDMQLTYLGYRRFLESDLRYIFPLGKERSNHSYKRDVKYLAKQMLIRGYAFAGAVKFAFPNYLRLSIHESTGEHKVSMSLLNTKTGFTTPWHCSVALMADGEWVSAPMGDFKKDPALELVFENGRPNHFRPKSDPDASKKVISKEETSVQEDGRPKQSQAKMEAINRRKLARQQRLAERFKGTANGFTSSSDAVDKITQPMMDEKHVDGSFTSASSCLDDSELEKITRLGKTVSRQGVRSEKEELINPILDSGNPLLNPNSDRFSSKAGLETLMSITSRDPEKYPKRVAGIAYKNLSAHGFGKSTDYQKTFGIYPSKLLEMGKRLVGSGQKTRIQILRDFDGLVKSGEMLMVLGRPGSGCSTLLKTVSGETDGFYVPKEAYLNYQGISKETMHKDFRGECMYQAEVDVHFPQLAVGQTLEFAARARAPRNRLPGVDQDTYAKHLRDVVMAMFGLSHPINTMAGNDFIPGVSGGERKRVSIAEAAIASSPLQCWDNSTRGLDSATALEFVRVLRSSTVLTGATAIVTLYQASQAIYDIFDKVAVLYEGRQIYFGDIRSAKAFFINLGFECLPRQTTADFLTSLTNPGERVIRKGFEGKTPYTPDEFAAVWQKSEDRAHLLQDIEEFDKQHPIGGPSLDEFKNCRKSQQARSQRPQSPDTLSVPSQIKLYVRRGYQRLRSDMTILITSIIFNSVMTLVVGSVFYNLGNDTSILYNRGTLLFFGILLAAFASALEVGLGLRSHRRGEVVLT